MLDEERRELIELMARYENEPKLRDIYVEGELDEAVVNWFLLDLDLSDVSVYQIDMVNIPTSEVIGLGQDDGNRGRVISLAILLGQDLPATSRQITCVIDKDFEPFIKRVPGHPFIFMTDYACTEMYLFHRNVLDKFLSLVARQRIEPDEDILAILGPVLQQLFFIRLTNYTLGYGLRWIDFLRFCSYASGTLTFNSRGYVRAYLNTEGLMAKQGEFESTLTAYMGNPQVDVRNQINGHDLINLLAWYAVRKGAPSRLFNAEHVERSLPGCIERSVIASSGLFQAIASRVSEK